MRRLITEPVVLEPEEGEPGPGGTEPGVPGYPPTPPEQDIYLPPPEGPTPPEEVVAPPVEPPAVEVPPVTIPPVEMPEVPSVTIPEIPDILAGLNELLSSTLSLLDEERLKKWLTVTPVPEIKTYVVREVITCPARQPGLEPETRSRQYFPTPGFRYTFLGPLVISADFYTKEAKVWIGPDMNLDWTPGGLVLTGPMSVDVPRAAFWRGGQGFMVQVENASYTDSVVVTFFFPVIEMDEFFYAQYWQPLTEHTFQAPLRLIEKITFGLPIDAGLPAL